eukprot:PhF_6_TR30629/c0_g1_i1/m.45124
MGKLRQSLYRQLLREVSSVVDIYSKGNNLKPFLLLQNHQQQQSLHSVLHPLLRRHYPQIAESHLLRTIDPTNTTSSSRVYLRNKFTSFPITQMDRRSDGSLLTVGFQVLQLLSANRNVNIISSQWATVFRDGSNGYQNHHHDVRLVYAMSLLESGEREVWSSSEEAFDILATMCRVATRAIEGSASPQEQVIKTSYSVVEEYLRTTCDRVKVLLPLTNVYKHTPPPPHVILSVTLLALSLSIGVDHGLTPLFVGGHHYIVFPPLLTTKSRTQGGVHALTSGGGLGPTVYDVMRGVVLSGKELPDSVMHAYHQLLRSVTDLTFAKPSACTDYCMAVINHMTKRKLISEGDYKAECLEEEKEKEQSSIMRLHVLHSRQQYVAALLSSP